MKKVLIGVGIGCGSLLLLGVIGMFAAGMWAKNTFGGMTAEIEEIGANHERATALNTRFDFHAPEDDQAYALTAGKLDTWMEVGAKLQARYKEIESEFELKSGEVKSLSEGIERAKAAARMVQETQRFTLDELERVGMAPAEFQAITHAVINGLSYQGKTQLIAHMQQTVKQIEDSRADTEARLNDPSVSEEERAMVRQVLAQQTEALSDMRKEFADDLDASDRAILEANAALIEGRREALQDLSSFGMAAGLFAIGN